MWLIHRLVAEASFVLFFALTGLTLILEGVRGDGLGGWVRTAVIAVITIAGIALRYSSARLRLVHVGMPGANENARFALGETLSWRVNGNEVMRVRSERLWRVGIYEVTLRKVERQGKKRPPLHPTGKLGYVRGVSLGPADILEMNGKQDGSVLRELEVPMDVLFHETAKIERAQISWCSHEERCLMLQDRCEFAGRSFR